MEDIQNKVNDSAKEFITGEKDIEKDFDSYISDLESLNLKEVIEVKQAQYKRYLKALGK
jgi:putative aldouronate transport system substrate-binding protein